METSTTRINYRLLGKIRGIKQQEKTQMFDDDDNRKIGVRVNWEHYGKVLEAKAKMELGDKGIIENPEPKKNNKFKFKFSQLFGNILNSLSINNI